LNLIKFVSVYIQPTSYKQPPTQTIKTPSRDLLLFKKVSLHMKTRH